jgi:hypothetical protein
MLPTGRAKICRKAVEVVVTHAIQPATILCDSPQTVRSANDASCAGVH